MVADAQMPLDGAIDEVQGLEMLAQPKIPFRPLPFLPIPPTWRPLLYDDCHCTSCRPVTPNTECCRNSCLTMPFFHRPQNQTKLGPVGIKDAKGSLVPIEAQTDLVLLASFISHDLVHSLHLEQTFERWPAAAPTDNRPAAVIIGTIPLTLANFTKAQLKFEDVFYVVEIMEPNGEENEDARFPEFSIGVELLRQISGLDVHPDVIV